MPTDQRMYFVAPTTVTTEMGEQRIPQYSQDPAMEGVNSSIMTADSVTAKPLGVAQGDDIFLARFRGDASYLDSIETKDHNLMRVVDDGAKTNAETVKESNFAKQLNTKYRPQNLAELLEQLGDEYRSLSADEWKERLGMTTDF